MAAMGMTQELKRVVRAAARLPADVQDYLAAIIEEEMADELRWASLFADPRSDTLLARLAAEALAEDDAGLTEACE